jgi:hypothetical protein
MTALQTEPKPKTEIVSECKLCGDYVTYRMLGGYCTICHDQLDNNGNEYEYDDNGERDEDFI